MIASEIQDSLYGTIRLADWAAQLAETPQFERLRGISLSSLPPQFWPALTRTTRWQHSLGVYHLACVACPEDQALQAAALLHDVGQPPFSHLAEHLMVEVLGVDHEQRAEQVIQAMRTAERVPEIDWTQVPELILGRGRGALLSGLLDFDNIDYLPRLFDGPAPYDPERLARGLVLVDGEVALLPEVEEQALAWRRVRQRVYDTLYDHGNLIPHAMLRKAVELIAADGQLPASFFDRTNDEALAFLARHEAARPLLERLWAREPYVCVWEAETALDLRLSWRETLALEAELAARVGWSPQAIVLELSTSRASRRLPPLLVDGELHPMPAPLPPRRVLHVFTAQPSPRLQKAAEALLGRWRK